MSTDKLAHLTEQERRDWELAQRVTPGPWVRWEEHASVFCNNNGLNNPGEMSGNQICECEPDDLPDDYGDDEDRYIIQAEDNAEFIARARTGYPAALEQLSSARGEIAGLRKRIHHVEGHNQYFFRCESGWCNPSDGCNPALDMLKGAVERSDAAESRLRDLREKVGYIATKNYNDDDVESWKWLARKFQEIAQKALEASNG